MKIVCRLHTYLVIIEILLYGNSGSADTSSSKNLDEFTLTILHSNDIHSKFLGVNKKHQTCLKNQHFVKKDCYGGFARLKYKIDEIRSSHSNVIYLYAGDSYEGSIWYSYYGWKAQSHFINQLGLTAMSLGNHEFDGGNQGILPFMQRANFPVIVANVDCSNEPRFAGLVKRSIVIEIQKIKIGIIGYITNETASISGVQNLTFSSEIEAVKQEAALLHERGVNILLALGHSGYEMDKEIARQVPYLDAVIGGHTHTFLYNGTPPAFASSVKGPYPTIITQTDGRQVPVLQAYKDGIYLGYLNLTFNKAGEVIRWKGRPILLNWEVPEDVKMVAELSVWNENLTKFAEEEIGQTHVLLDGNPKHCRLGECNIGSILADALVYSKNGTTKIGLFNNGIIRATVDASQKNGSLTVGDLYTLLPYDETVEIVELKGKHLRKTLEFSVEEYNPNYTRGKFVQVSGIRVVFNVSAPYGQRVQSVEVLTESIVNGSAVQSFGPLNDGSNYKIVTINYMANGKDGYSMLSNNLISRQEGSEIQIRDVLRDYLKIFSPITQTTDGRILVVQNTS